MEMQLNYCEVAGLNADEQCSSRLTLYFLILIFSHCCVAM